jgi:hypothetical protein
VKASVRHRHRHSPPSPLSSFQTALLPGVDPNDMLKSIQTIACFSSVLECVPLIDADDLEGVAEPVDSLDTSDPAAVLGLLPAWHPAAPANRVSALFPCGHVAVAPSAASAAAMSDGDGEQQVVATDATAAESDAAAFLAARRAQVRRHWDFSRTCIVYHPVPRAHPCRSLSWRRSPSSCWTACSASSSTRRKRVRGALWACFDTYAGLAPALHSIPLPTPSPLPQPRRRRTAAAPPPTRAQSRMPWEASFPSSLRR